MPGPNLGVAPIIGKNVGDTNAAIMRSARSVCWNVIPLTRHAARLAKVVFLSCQSRKSGAETALNGHAGSHSEYSRTSCCGCGNGKDRTRTALRTLKTVTFAPIPAPKVKTATTVNPGDFNKSQKAYRKSWMTEAMRLAVNSWRLAVHV